MYRAGNQTIDLVLLQHQGAQHHVVFQLVARGDFGHALALTQFDQTRHILLAYGGRIDDFDDYSTYYDLNDYVAIPYEKEQALEDAVNEIEEIDDPTQSSEPVNPTSPQEDVSQPIESPVADLAARAVIKKASITTLESRKKGTVYVAVKKQADVDGYEYVYSKKATFKGKKVIRKKASAFTIPKLTKGSSYYVKVRAYQVVGGKRVYAPYSKKKKVKISYVNQVTKASVKKLKNQTVKVRWKKVSGATSYQVGYALKAKGKKKWLTTKKTTITLPKKKAKQTYWIQIVAKQTIKKKVRQSIPSKPLKCK